MEGHGYSGLLDSFFCRSERYCHKTFIFL